MIRRINNASASVNRATARFSRVFASRGVFGVGTGQLDADEAILFRWEQRRNLYNEPAILGIQDAHSAAFHT